ncbi:aminotransferase class I/II-fold pyridoxal phosphate-dependent enzyme [bacterium]|nr:aminotransferase class I/II-fold pyridoxal phosphate-dependent enzyme [bacterium]
MISQRVKKIKESGIRKVFELSANNKGDLIDLSIGQPHFNTPNKLKKAISEAVSNDFNKYTPTNGFLNLRNKIAVKLRKENNILAKSDDIIVTSGVSGGLFLTFATLLNRGDEVVLPDPYFVLYDQLLRFFGVKPVYWSTYPDFHLKNEKLEKLITSKTRAIIINSPNNPTGMVYGEHEIRELVKIAKKNKLFIVSDEVYEKFDYDKKFFSAGSIYSKTITLNGFSKSHLITGWRIGYVHGPGEIIGAMNKLQQYTFVCAPSPAQAALENEWHFDFSPYVREYKVNRDYIVKELSPSLKFNLPEGAYYAFIKKPKDNTDFINKLVKNNVLVVPGEVFSRKKDYFRLSFAVSLLTLKKGIKIINEISN